MQYKCLFFNAYFRTYKCFSPQKSKQKLVGNWKPGATTNTISKEFKEISLSRAPIPKFHCFDTRMLGGQVGSSAPVQSVWTVTTVCNIILHTLSKCFCCCCHLSNWSFYCRLDWWSHWWPTTCDGFQRLRNFTNGKSHQPFNLGIHHGSNRINWYS